MPDENIPVQNPRTPNGDGISVSPTIVSRLKEKGANVEAWTIAEAIASLDELVTEKHLEMSETSDAKPKD